jgi:alpha-1,6-mannosyltransferase
LGPGRYLVLCAALFILLAGRIWTDAWRGDFWIYVATVKELALHPLHPRNPLLGNDYAFAFFSPYTWALGVASRLSGLSSFEVLVLQGFVNLALFLSALYAFVTTWVGRRSAAFYALLFALFLWGRDPWIFSSFFHFRSLSFVLSYPSTFAAALALGSLALFARLAGSGSLVWVVVVVPAIALLWIFHPVNGLFLWLGLLALSLQTPRTTSHWLGLAFAFVASLGLAFAWPLFSVWDLWFGQIEQVHEGNAAVYDDPFPRIAPALLGAPWLLMRLKRNKRDPLALLALGLTVLVAYGGLFGKWSYGRLLSHVVLLLQVALADASAALEERLGQLRAGAALRHFQAPALAALLVGASWSSAVKPTLEEGWHGNPRWLDFLESRVETYDVVLTDLETCWYVPSFSGKVVAFPMHLPFVPDHAARVRAVERFFGPEASFDERRVILGRYRVRWVLLEKEHITDWRARLEELRPIARVVFSDAKHELLRVGSAAPVPVARIEP